MPHARLLPPARVFPFGLPRSLSPPFPSGPAAFPAGAERSGPARPARPPAAAVFQRPPAARHVHLPGKVGGQAVALHELCRAQAGMDRQRGPLRGEVFAVLRIVVMPGAIKGLSYLVPCPCCVGPRPRLPPLPSPLYSLAHRSSCSPPSHQAPNPSSTLPNPPTRPPPTHPAGLCLQDLYVGLSPYTAPAVFALLAGTELTDGVWYPRGGFQQVRRQLRRWRTPRTCRQDRRWKRRAAFGCPPRTHMRCCCLQPALTRAPIGGLFTTLPWLLVPPPPGAGPRRAAACRSGLRRSRPHRR